MLQTSIHLWHGLIHEARKTKTVIGVELNESDHELPEGGDIQEEDNNESFVSETSDSRRNLAGKMQCHTTVRSKDVKRARRYVAEVL